MSERDGCQQAERSGMNPPTDPSRCYSRLLRSLKLPVRLHAQCLPAATRTSARRRLVVLRSSSPRQPLPTSPNDLTRRSKQWRTVYKRRRAGCSRCTPSERSSFANPPSPLRPITLTGLSSGCPSAISPNHAASSFSNLRWHCLSRPDVFRLMNDLLL